MLKGENSNKTLFWFSLFLDSICFQVACRGDLGAFLGMKTGWYWPQLFRFFSGGMQGLKMCRCFIIIRLKLPAGGRARWIERWTICVRIFYSGRVSLRRAPVPAAAGFGFEELQGVISGQSFCWHCRGDRSNESSGSPLEGYVGGTSA